MDGAPLVSVNYLIFLILFGELNAGQAAELIFRFEERRQDLHAGIGKDDPSASLGARAGVYSRMIA